MTAAAQEALELLQGPIKAAGAEIILDPAMPQVFADKQRIREVLQNLIENAVKYRERTGSAENRDRVPANTGRADCLLCERQRHRHRSPIP